MVDDGESTGHRSDCISGTQSALFIDLHVNGSCDMNGFQVGGKEVLI